MYFSPGVMDMTEWFVFYPSFNEITGASAISKSEAVSTVEAALLKARRIMFSYEDKKLEYDPRKFCIYKKEPEDTEARKYGRFNVFGNFVREVR
jgi:hypothetical protein